MRTMVVTIAALLVSTAALAQTSAPAPTGATPMVGDRPLVQIKPKGAKADKPAKPAAAPKQSVAERLQGCLELEDGTKERLMCFDGIFPPKPPKAGTKLKPAKAVADCKLLKEEDERLACYNGFAESVPKLPKR